MPMTSKPHLLLRRLIKRGKADWYVGPWAGAFWYLRTPDGPDFFIRDLDENGDLIIARYPGVPYMFWRDLEVLVDEGLLTIADHDGDRPTRLEPAPGMS